MSAIHERTVGEIMARDVITLSEDQDLQNLLVTMHLFRFRHLPVVEDGRLVGVLSQRDLLRISASSLLPHAGEQTAFLAKSRCVRDVMTRDVSTVHPDTTLIDAARLLHLGKVGCLPVIDDANVLVGIVTEDDFLKLALRALEAAP